MRFSAYSSASDSGYIYYDLITIYYNYIFGKPINSTVAISITNDTMLCWEINGPDYGPTASIHYDLENPKSKPEKDIKKLIKYVKKSWVKYAINDRIIAQCDISGSQ